LLIPALRAKLAPALLSGNIASALVGASQALRSMRPDLRDGIVGLMPRLVSPSHNETRTITTS
jgi:hypothetical protein